MIQFFIHQSITALLTTLQVMLGRRPMAAAWPISAVDYWIVIWANWLLAGLVGLAPALHMGAGFFASFMASALVSLLLFSWLVHGMLRLMGRPHLFLGFIIPWFWVAALQMILALIVSVPAFLLDQAGWQVFSLPLVVWALYWMIRIARDRLGFGLLAAIGLMLGRMLIEAGLGLVAGTGLILG